MHKHDWDDYCIWFIQSVIKVRRQASSKFEERASLLYAKAIFMGQIDSLRKTAWAQISTDLLLEIPQLLFLPLYILPLSSVKFKNLKAVGRELSSVQFGSINMY